ncbi:DSD1 family PLP-dependent enzyme [Nordella sp. HKS 07]|uniref:DSD1 family PLP-dependent enzyme n=1 Tax=Nordella sp. HKS 07 TaxID=2712222 RepID=UPI0013E17658|nr:DSD1 family PLP-dependent enzyme [Nordella sp. HKS 07]QIG49990.1 DSD1 family PLP-dependent enzyme [Nordella sp. HKS 07]
MAAKTARKHLPTPALVIDVDLLDRNIATMTARAKAMGVKLRPHAKAHKCVEIAQRLARSGAVGASCATIGEAEGMALGGIGGILITSPMVTSHQLERLRRLLLRGADISIVADHPANAQAYADIGTATGRRLDVLVDFDFGLGRTGCVEMQDAVALAQRIDALPSLHYRGIQAYWGNLQQVMPLSERVRLASIQQDRVRSLSAALKSAGLAPEIVSGAGTGTHVIDGGTGLFTELQPGSFLFMDSCYGSIVTNDSENPFLPSLFVAASVVSANRPGCVIVNAGWKAFATDSGKPQPWRGTPPGASYRFMGDEHGAVDFEGDGPALGDTIEFLTSHCDPTVNLHPAFHVVRGEEVVDLWPIRARY